MSGPVAGESPDQPARPSALGEAEAVVARAIAGGALWPAGATVVAAVSGGADSLCLLGTLLALRELGQAGAPGDIVVATLDHGLRGAAGAEDTRWVAELAASLGLRCVADQVDAREHARVRHLSPEDAARRLRYAFLRRVAGDVGAARIALGHTLDDQAETILLHLLRGSGLDGLAGMRPLRGDLARPLLGLTHAQAMAWCAARGWLPREDLTNRDERYLRNRVRRRLLPLLEAYNPGVRRTLAHNAAFIADDLALLEAMTDDAWAEAVAREDEAWVALRLASLREVAPALRRRLLRRAALRLASGDALEAGGLEARHIALIERLIASGRTGAALTLPNGLRATLGYETLTLARGEEPLAVAVGSPAGEWALPIPGVVEIPALGWRLRAVPLAVSPGLEGAALPAPPAVAPLAYGGSVRGNRHGELRVYLDADRIGAALTARAWRPGDRMRPLGMAAEKKLQDVFADAKTPRALRSRLPIVCVGGRIAWVVGVRISDDFKLTEATQRALALQAEPLSDDLSDDLSESL